MIEGKKKETLPPNNPFDDAASQKKNKGSAGIDVVALSYIRAENKFSLSFCTKRAAGQRTTKNPERRAAA